ncbi:transglycosylase SLT domain-containing protein [Actinoplanes sp. TBRC 11911]|uniref:lytic murein transglycosylase n=1 Tax=Actinoplanes sp. TBRC 11911 TaxID=2729386 RepID=UPI00145CB05B|nr:lytic murein transglycosylase [Actinoplanes sp. TBRC 11911]NMO50243.1 transglycosylase SLT domain-containing protein [Actinoplanes sp. TBRC 11911]
MTDGQQEKPATRPALRASAPHQGGPLGSSGAAPDQTAPARSDPDSVAPAAAAATREPSDTNETAPGRGDAAGATPEQAGTAPEQSGGLGETPEQNGDSGGTQSGDSGSTQSREAGGTQSREAGGTQSREAGGTQSREAGGTQSREAGGTQSREAGGAPERSGRANAAPQPRDGERSAGGSGPDATERPSDGTAAAAESPDARTDGLHQSPSLGDNSDMTVEGGAAGAPAEAGDTAARAPAATPTIGVGNSSTPATGAGNSSTPATGAAAGGAKARHLRRASPLRVVKRAGRSTSAWAKRPSGRLIVPAVIAILLLAGAGTAGVYLVPQAIEAAPSPSATPAFGPSGALGPLPAPSASLPLGSLPGGGAATVPTGLATGAATPPAANNGVPGTTTGRPSDVLNGWAQQVGTQAGIPVVAVQAYGYAELVVARTTPACHLSWTTIAAIGEVESSHGSYKTSVLGADGLVQPPIYGLPLDGKGGRQLIRDTDQGTIDGDTTYDRAVGPLQFIPSTWLAFKVDADNNGTADPNDIDDASLAAANYLCQGGRDMSKLDSWWEAILSYNAVQPYAQKVFETANEYGQRSR